MIMLYLVEDGTMFIDVNVVDYALLVLIQVNYSFKAINQIHKPLCYQKGSEGY